MDKLGFTFKAVRAANPDIVYAAAVGFGRHGRYAGKPAYDDVIQAASGFAGLFQMRDGAPLYAPSIAADKVSGLHLAYAVMAALLYRERTGKAPGYVEVPMFELMAAFSLCEHLGAATFEDGGKVGYVRVLSPGRRPYKTKDGWVGVLPYTERNWTKILTEIGRAEVAELAWFKNATERSRRVDELYAILAEALPARTTAEWLAIFERLDIPSQPVRLPNDLLRDPHLADVGFFDTAFAAEHAGQAHAAPGRQRRGRRQPSPTCRRRCSAPTRRPCCAKPAAARPRSPPCGRIRARADCHPGLAQSARAGTRSQELHDQFSVLGPGYSLREFRDDNITPAPAPRRCPGRRRCTWKPAHSARRCAAAAAWRSAPAARPRRPADGRRRSRRRWD